MSAEQSFLGIRNIIVEPRKPIVKYLVQLRMPNLWLSFPNKWVEPKKHATRFPTFSEAETASDGYDVIIRTVEE